MGNGNGRIDLDEFKATMTHDTRLVTLLSSMEIDTSNLDVLFHLLSSGNPFLTLEGWERGIIRLRGPARSIDMSALFYQIGFLQNALKKMQESVNTWSDDVR